MQCILVFVAYYDSMNFSKICSEGRDIPRILELSLLFVVSFATSQIRMTRLGPKVGQIGTKYDKVGFFIKTDSV